MSRQLLLGNVLLLHWWTTTYEKLKNKKDELGIQECKTFLFLISLTLLLLHCSLLLPNEQYLLEFANTNEHHCLSHRSVKK